jgi:ribA/ribD-fused uncharacterized protein
MEMAYHCLMRDFLIIEEVMIMNSNLLTVNDYDDAFICKFHKVRDKWGGLSNMSNEFPVTINHIFFRNSEALYQCIRFTSHPEIQKEIVNQRSGFSSKLISKKYRSKYTRSDWDSIRVEVMKWVVRVKLANNFEYFSRLLIETNNLEIVEYSKKDAFWGAKEVKNSSILRGANVLGKILIEIRDILLNGDEKSIEDLKHVPPLKINNFNLYGKPISAVGLLTESFKEAA